MQEVVFLLSSLQKSKNWSFLFDLAVERVFAFWLFYKCKKA